MAVRNFLPPFQFFNSIFFYFSILIKFLKLPTLLGEFLINVFLLEKAKEVYSFPSFIFIFLFLSAPLISFWHQVLISFVVKLSLSSQNLLPTPLHLMKNF